MNRTLIRGAVAAALLGALLAAPFPALASGRFDLQRQPVTIVNDTTRIDVPAIRAWSRYPAYVDDQFLQPVDQLLALRGVGRAQDLNCLDQVPVSTWFNPVPGSAPPVRLDAAASLEVLDARLDGPDPFLVVRDKQGQRCWLDFDMPGAPERRTAAAVVSARLLRAAGFPVLDCDIESITYPALMLAPGAGRTGEYWSQGELRAADLERFLAGVAAADGTVRVAASRLPAGIAIGSFGERGVRSDDPNDCVPHQNRRSLRGLAVLAAWLDYSTFREDRTLDVYLQPQGYVRHFIRGLARTLGAGPREPQEKAPEGFGVLADPGFDPRAWAPLDPCAFFQAMQWGDALWGVQRLLAVSPAEIQAAVKAGGLSDPEQAELLAGALIERRERIARAWLEAINGADGFVVREAARGRWTLECEETGVCAGLRQGEDVILAMTMTLPDAGETWGLQTRGGAEARFDLVPFLPPAWLHRLDARRYAIAEVRAWNYRGHALAGTARVHLYFDRDSGPRIVGIERD